MNKLILIVSVFVIIFLFNVNTYASDESEQVTQNETIAKYDVQGVIDNPNSSDSELLRAILVCIKDIDLYIQFFVTLVFAVGLVYFVILKPIRYFLY